MLGIRGEIQVLSSLLRHPLELARYHMLPPLAGARNADTGSAFTGRGSLA